MTAGSQAPRPRALLTACPVPFQFCQAKQKAALLELLHELYNFLAIQAGEYVSPGTRLLNRLQAQAEEPWVSPGRHASPSPRPPQAHPV